MSVNLWPSSSYPAVFAVRHFEKAKGSKFHRTSRPHYIRSFWFVVMSRVVLTGSTGHPNRRSSWQSPPFRRFFATGQHCRTRWNREWHGPHDESLIWTEMVGFVRFCHLYLKHHLCLGSQHFTIFYPWKLKQNALLSRSIWPAWIPCWAPSQTWSRHVIARVLPMRNSSMQVGLLLKAMMKWMDHMSKTQGVGTKLEWGSSKFCKNCLAE